MKHKFFYNKEYNPNIKLNNLLNESDNLEDEMEKSKKDYGNKIIEINNIISNMNTEYYE